MYDAIRVEHLGRCADPFKDTTGKKLAIANKSRGRAKTNRQTEEREEVRIEDATSKTARDCSVIFLRAICKTRVV